jgi:hypothetical protein
LLFAALGNRACAMAIPGIRSDNAHGCQGRWRGNSRAEGETKKIRHRKLLPVAQERVGEGRVRMLWKWQPFHAPAA